MEIEVLLKDLMTEKKWEKYVTQEQREIYLKTQTIQTNSRKAIEMSLGECYEIKGWLGRGEKNRRILLEKRSRPVVLRYRNGNLRNNQTEYKETLLQMTYSYFNDLSDEELKKGYIENVSSKWLQQMGIVHQNFNKSVPPFIPDELDTLTSKNQGMDFTEEYINRRKRLFRDEFLWIKDNISYITFEEVYVGVDNKLKGTSSERIRDLTSEEVSIMKTIEEELVNKYSYKRYGLQFNEWMRKRFNNKYKLDDVWKVFRVYTDDIEKNKKNYQIYSELKMDEYDFLLNFQTELYFNILKNEFFMGKDKKNIIPYDFTDQVYISELGMYLADNNIYEDDAYYFLRKNRELLKMNLYYDDIMRMSCNGVLLLEEDYSKIKNKALSEHDSMLNNEITKTVEGTLVGEDWEVLQASGYNIEDLYSERSINRYFKVRGNTQNGEK